MSLTGQSASHRFVLMGGLLQVHHLDEPRLVRTTAREGQVVQEIVESADPKSADGKLLAHFRSAPLFAAGRAGGGYTVDLQAGFQRWRGWKSGRAVGLALRRCGFESSIIARLLRAMRAWGDTHVPRF